MQRGKAALICGWCGTETDGVSGELREDPNKDTEFAWGEEGPWFFPDTPFVCLYCQTENHFYYAEFKREEER